MDKTLQQNLTHTDNKLLGLEVVRFISALSVLIWHYQHFSYIAERPIGFIKERQPLYSALSIFYDYGFYGVEVFWCISGFVLFLKYRDSIASGNIDFYRFFILRFSRLYPLHIFTLLLVTYLQAIYFAKNDCYFVYLNNDIGHFICQIFLASNWGFEKGQSFNGPIWSVSIEVLVYGLFFLTLKAAGKSLYVTLAVLLLCLAAKYFKFTSSLFDCAAFFYIGGLTAIAFKSMQATKYKKTVLPLLALALLASSFIIYTTDVYKETYFPILMLIFYTPVLILFGARQIRAPKLVRDAIAAAGNMTYASYLIHFPLQLIIAIYFSNTDGIPYYSLAFFIFYITATLAISFRIYKLFEIPAQNYIRMNCARPGNLVSLIS
jgi:peptidoglycan/LPS O-acetylase OafA/YrhL